MTQIIIHANHIRRAQLCSRGARQWFTLHGLDWQEFITKGIEIEKIDALHDAFGDKVAALARSEAEGEEDE